MTLQQLADIPRDRTRWPEGFVWDYSDCASCAMGLAVAIAEGRSMEDAMGYEIEDAAAKLFPEMSDDVFMDMFHFLGNRLNKPPCIVTPEDVAGAIDSYLGVPMINIEVTLVLDTRVPPSWTVEAINADGDGGVDVTIFSGPLAEQRAREYAVWKYGAADPEILVP